jgi:hypothetical protein
MHITAMSAMYNKVLILPLTIFKLAVNLHTDEIQWKNFCFNHSYIQFLLHNTAWKTFFKKIWRIILYDSLQFLSNYYGVGFISSDKW